MTPTTTSDNGMNIGHGDAILIGQSLQGNAARSIPNRKITACRSCGSTRLEPVLNLGKLCISDFVDDMAYPRKREDRAPLELVVCQDCTLVQLRHTVDRDRLYREYYYRSGTNETMVAALKDVVDEACGRVRLNKNDKVMDIGANDGTMLRMFPKRCVRVGYEPSDMGRDLFLKAHDVTVFPHFFPEAALDEPGTPYKVITSIAMFYDIDDPNAFVAAIAKHLHPDGIWVCQMQDLHGMLAVNGFDNICHEHLCYWSRDAFYQLCARHGLRVDAVSTNQTNGGSVRYIVRHGDWQPPKPAPSRAQEFAFQLRSFAAKAEDLKAETLDLLERLKKEGKSVYGMAASTKGNTTLQFYGVTSDLLACIIDRNPEKWGLYTVGTHIPIAPEDALRDGPDYLLNLAWHFQGAFESRYKDYRGRWIVPLPELRIVEGKTCQHSTEGLCAKA